MTKPSKKNTLDMRIFLSIFITIIERDVAQWLKHRDLPMSLPAVRFRIPLGAGFSEKKHVSPLYFHFLYPQNKIFAEIQKITREH